MSEKTKKMWTVIAILFVIGVGMTLIGVIAGGTKQAKEILKEEESSAHGIAKYVHLTDDGFYIGTKSDDGEKEVSNSSGDRMETEIKRTGFKEEEAGKVTKADAVSHLVLKLDAGEIILEESSDEYISIQSEGDLVKVTTELKGDTLAVEMKQKKKIGTWPGTGERKATHVIYLPSKEYDSMKVSVGAGELTVRAALDVKEMEIKLGAGEVEADKISCERIRAEIGAGSMELSRIKANKLDVDVAMGSFEVEQADAREIVAKVAMGEADIGVTAREEETSYEAKCGMGQLRIGSKKVEGSGSQRKESKEKEKLELWAECGMGEVNVSFAQ